MNDPQVTPKSRGKVQALTESFEAKSRLAECEARVRELEKENRILKERLIKKVCHRCLTSCEEGFYDVNSPPALNEPLLPSTRASSSLQYLDEYSEKSLESPRDTPSQIVSFLSSFSRPTFKAWEGWGDSKNPDTTTAVSTTAVGDPTTNPLLALKRAKRLVKG